MKKLQNISNQIKTNTFSYTGKGAFEAVFHNYKLDIVGWLENLIPLQQQILNLEEKAFIQFQKRNYARILTKILPDEYNEFVSINILVRDSRVIGEYYQEEFNLTLLYEILLRNKYLKYPGQSTKYVAFDIFQKFMMMYRDDLLVSTDIKEVTVDTTSQKVVTEKVEEKTDWINLLTK